MERLRGGGKKSTKSRKRKHPPEKPADDETPEAAAPASAADDDTLQRAETSPTTAQISFFDDAPEQEVRARCRFRLHRVNSSVYDDRSVVCLSVCVLSVRASLAKTDEPI